MSNEKEVIAKVRGLLVVLENNGDTDSEIWTLKAIFELLKGLYKELITKQITGIHK